MSSTATPAHAPAATLGVRLSLLVMVLYFGGSFPAYSLAGLAFGPATTNLIRFAIATAVLTAVAWRRLPPPDVRLRLAMIGTFGIGLMAVLLGAGVDEGSATVGSIIVGLEPIGVTIAGVVLVGDVLAARSVVALVVGFAGALVASGLFTEPAGKVRLLAIVMLLGTVVTFSIYTARVRLLRKGVDPLAVAAVTHWGALAFVVPACLFDVFRKGMYHGHLPGRSVAAVLFLGFGSALAYLLLCLVLANQPSSRVAVSLFLTPVLGVVFSWWIVGESLQWRDAVGGALVLLAVWISERAAWSRR